MKKELVDLQPKLEQAKIENTKMMEVKMLHNTISLLNLLLTVGQFINIFTKCALSEVKARHRNLMVASAKCVNF